MIGKSIKWAGWPSGLHTRFSSRISWVRGFEFRSGRDKFQTISMSSLYPTCPGLSIKWTGWRLVTDSGTKCAWVIHESKAVQIHVHNNRRCLYVPRVPGSVKHPHNNTKIDYAC